MEEGMELCDEIKNHCLFKVGDDDNKKFNVDAILEHLRKFRNEKIIVKEICSIIKEPRNDILINLLREVGKDTLLGLLENTLKIENEGGLIRKDQKNLNNGKKTPGGVLMDLARKNCGFTKPQIKKIFLTDREYQIEKKKIKKQLNKMLIS